MTATVKYIGNLECELTHIKSGTKIKTDAPVDNNGKGSAFSPSDLVATATAACMMTIMGIAAQRNKWNLEGTDIDVVKIMSAEPRKISELQIKIKFPQNDFDDRAKKILERVAMNCPVILSLHPDIKKTFEFVW